MDEEGAEIIHDELRDVGVEPVFGEGVERFEVDRLGHVTDCVGTTGTVYDCDMAGVCVGLDLSTEHLDDTDVDTDEGIITDEHMQTADERIFAAGDVAEFHDVILDERNLNGAWDSAREQGKIAALNMVAAERGEEFETFELVPNYSVSHFSMPFMSLGSPTKGDEYASRRYGEKEHRRLAFKDGKLVGAVLVGNVRAVGAMTHIMKQKQTVIDKKDELLAETVDPEAVLTD